MASIARLTRSSSAAFQPFVPNSAKRQKEETPSSSSSSAPPPAEWLLDSDTETEVDSPEPPSSKKRQKLPEDSAPSLCGLCQKIDVFRQEPTAGTDQEIGGMHDRLAELYRDRVRFHRRDCIANQAANDEDDEKQMEPDEGPIPALIEKILPHTTSFIWKKVIEYATKALIIIEAQPPSTGRSFYFKDRECQLRLKMADAIYRLRWSYKVDIALDHLRKAKNLTLDPNKLGVIYLQIAKLLIFRDRPKEAQKMCDLCKSIEVLKLAPDSLTDRGRSRFHRSISKLYHRRVQKNHPPCIPERMTRSLSNCLSY